MGTLFEEAAIRYCPHLADVGLAFGMVSLLGLQLVPVLAAAPLRLAILFGSAARGTARTDSDVDIGILPADSAWPLAAELALAGDLERACGRPVDLVRLDHVNEVVRWLVARDGVVLLSEPAYEAVRFIARAASEHADFGPRVEAALRRESARTRSA